MAMVGENWPSGQLAGRAVGLVGHRTKVAMELGRGALGCRPHGRTGRVGPGVGEGRSALEQWVGEGLQTEAQGSGEGAWPLLSCPRAQVSRARASAFRRQLETRRNVEAHQTAFSPAQRGHTDRS